MRIAIKRAYDKPAAADGYRVLVDRLWPRGVKKELLALDEWCKDVAPSSNLRVWFGHKSDKFEEFSARYVTELETSNTPRQLLERAHGCDMLTLVYATRDPRISHALVLRGYLESLQ